jgi:hypothetical protein
MSSAGAASALGVLGVLAGAGTAVSAVAAQSVAAALSAVAFAPAASPGSGGSASNFGAVLGILDSLASSQSAGQQVPGQAPATVNTPNIQMSVALDEPDSPRLFAAPLSAPGSNSSFDALPAGALAGAGGQPVSTLFLSLAFDPHASGNSSVNNTGGLTRLAFSTPAAPGGTSAPVAVENLPTPLLFSVPASTLAPGQQSACAWWDERVAEYSSAGCATLPSPYPPGHTVSFVANFTVSGPASLTRAWEISGPLLEGCEAAFLDCTNATVRTERLQLDGPSLSCGNSSTLVLRAYTGARCALRLANASGCAWSVTTQAFVGGGCVPASATRCSCTHLTDFVSSSKPNLPMASLSDLVGLNPADLVTKLKCVRRSAQRVCGSKRLRTLRVCLRLRAMTKAASLARPTRRLLFTVVITLFGIMNIGAGVGFVFDARERADVAERLHTPGCGFRVVAESGVHLWRFGVDELPDELAAPTGPAVQLSLVFGLPFARLRAALPDELFTTDLSGARASASTSCPDTRHALTCASACPYQRRWAAATASAPPACAPLPSCTASCCPSSAARRSRPHQRRGAAAARTAAPPMSQTAASSRAVRASRRPRRGAWA